MFLTQNEILYAIVFLLVGFLTSFFSKNMIVILCISIVVTNILKYGTKIRMNEGFENAPDDEADTNDDDDDGFENEKKDTDSMDDKKPKKDTDHKKDGFRGKSDDKGELPGSIKDDYMALMDIQKQIVENMSKIEQPLSKAEQIVERMRSKQEKFRNKRS